MNWYQRLKKSHSERIKREISRRAAEVITPYDFNGRMYIAFNDIPLVLIPEDWNSQQIVIKLSELRQNYINSFINN